MTGQWLPIDPLDTALLKLDLLCSACHSVLPSIVFAWSMARLMGSAGG